MLWFSDQWNDIKGNFKFAVICFIGSGIITGIVALTHGLLLWQQIALAALFTFTILFITGVTAPMWIRHPIRPGHAPVASPAIDAPQLLIRFLPRTPRGEMLELINDGPGSIVDLEVGSLTWHEQRSIGILSGIGTIPAGHQEQRDVWLMMTENQMTGLYDFMRSHAPPEAETTVTIVYRDSGGRRFARDFLLTAQPDGGIVWAPGPVKLLN